MKIGLIGLNSQFVHSTLALYYLRESAPSFGQCSINEYSVNDPLLDIFYDISSEDWDVLAFSVYIWNKETLLKLLPLLKEVMPHTVFVVGGPEPTYAPVDFPLSDYIVYGALENTWPQLLTALYQGEATDLPGLKGIPQFAQTWHFPYRATDLADLEHRLVYYETSRGCPYQCGFCLSSVEKSTAFLPIERVKEELLFFLKAEIPVVKLVDRTFNYPKERARDIVEFLLANYSPKTTFHFELKGELLDDEIIELFAKAPKDFFQVEIGIQTLNEAALKASKRKNQWQETKVFYQKLGKMDNIHTHFDLIAALPYEDYQSFQYSFNEAMSIFPSHLQLGFLKLLPGTDFYRDRAEHGYVAETYPPYEVVANKYITSRELRILKKIDKFMDSYYNKGLYCNLFRLAMDKYEGTLFSLFHSLAVSNQEPIAALCEIMPHSSEVWQSLGRFDEFLIGRKLQVTTDEEKTLRELLKDEAQIKKLLPQYEEMPSREIYKRLRLGVFPIGLKAENGKIVAVGKGSSTVLFDYKTKGMKKNTLCSTEFMLL